MHRYPTLALIDQARGPEHPAFADDPAATSLEERARKLADEDWSEFVWLTGLISGAAFDAVVAALHRDRQARTGAVSPRPGRG